MIRRQDDAALRRHIIAPNQAYTCNQVENENREPTYGMVEDRRRNIGFVEILAGRGRFRSFYRLRLLIRRCASFLFLFLVPYSPDGDKYFPVFVGHSVNWG